MYNLSEQADVIVVGAGLSGLAAAKLLADNGVNVLVLEARNRAGGKTYDIKLPDGSALELGGEYVGPTHTHIQELAKSLGIKTFPVYSRGHSVLVVHDRRYFYKWFPMLPISSLIWSGIGFLKLGLLSRRVSLSEPWNSKDASFFDSRSLDDWISSNVKNQLAGDAVRLAFRTMLAEEPSKVSLLHALFFVRSGEGIKKLTAVSGGAQEARFVGGAQLISEKLALAMECSVFFNRPVSKIQWTKDNVIVHCCDGSTFHARRAILAMSPVLASKINYEPKLPEAHVKLMSSVPNGRVIKFNAIYPEPWWRSEGLSGMSAQIGGLITATFDNTPPLSSPGAITGFVEGEGVSALSSLTDDQKRKVILDELGKLFGSKSKKAEDILLMDWTQERWSLGAYGGYFPPGVWSRYGKALRESVGPLYWAGTEVSPIWMLYMEGAVRAGQMAAQRVLQSL
jgi:monoamine oxidase